MTENTKIESALIVEGGAMRGIYSAGVLDEFIKADYYPFDWYFGVSAGASNTAAYLGKKHGRNYKVITDYCRRPEFKSLRRFLRGGHLIDIDWLWDITERELDIGLDEIETRKGRFLAVVTDAETGEPDYIAPDRNEVFQAIKCSAAMPLAFRNSIQFRGKTWLDGGVADSLPVKEAYRRGARKIMVIRSNPASYRKQAYRFRHLFPYILRQYPAIAKRLQRRHLEYNEALDFIRTPPSDCEVIELCPPESFSAGQFTTDMQVLDDAYQMGIVDGARVVASRQF
ncbi:patatin family protein [Thalassolituus sp.]|uniref:patatin-like phospholipase family protein n=1 Tax=Thalassolituus sp. TaxID=2030822 RepID=UPI003519317E